MHIRVAAYGLIIDDGRVLLAHWNQNGRSGWTPPGGALRNESDGSTDEAAWFARDDVAALDRVELVDNALARRE